jgi:hypothetical protein
MFSKLMKLFNPRCSFFEKKAIQAIDLTDLFSEEPLELPEFGAVAGDFKVFSSNEDYNREFLYVFQACKKSFFLDYNHKDGHFRV